MENTKAMERLGIDGRQEDEKAMEDWETMVAPIGKGAA